MDWRKINSKMRAKPEVQLIHFKPLKIGSMPLLRAHFQKAKK